MKITASDFSVGSLPFDHPDDVVARDFLDAGRDVALQIDAERERLEPFRVGCLESLIHCLAGEPEELFARLAREPAGEGECGLVRVHA